MRPSIHWPASPPAGATIEVKCSAYQLEWERISSIDTKCHLSRGEGDWANGWGYWNQSPGKGLASLQSGVALGERLRAGVGRYTCIPHWSTFYTLGFSPWKRVVPDYYFSLCTKLYTQPSCNHWKKKSMVWVTCGTPEEADRYQLADCSLCSSWNKKSGVGEVWWARGTRLLVSVETILANHQMTQEGKVVLYLSIGVLLPSAEGTVGILQGSPQSQWQCLEKAESGDDGDNLPITRSEVIEAGKQLLGSRISGEGSLSLWTLWGFLGWHPPATSHTDLGQCLWTGRLGWMFPSLKRLTRGCTQIAGGSHYSDSKGRCMSTYKRGDYVLNLGFRWNKAVTIWL